MHRFAFITSSIFILFACGCEPPTPPQNTPGRPLNIELESVVQLDSVYLDEDGSRLLMLNLLTNFPIGTQIVLRFTDNRDAVREPMSRETSDTFLVTDSLLHLYVPVSMLPGNLTAYVPQEIQTDSARHLIARNFLVPFDQAYCPEFIFCTNYYLDFKYQTVSETDSFLIRALPLEVIFSRMGD